MSKAVLTKCLPDKTSKAGRSWQNIFLTKCLRRSWKNVHPDKMSADLIWKLKPIFNLDSQGMGPRAQLSSDSVDKRLFMSLPKHPFTSALLTLHNLVMNTCTATIVNTTNAGKLDFHNRKSSGPNSGLDLISPPNWQLLANPRHLSIRIK